MDPHGRLRAAEGRSGLKSPEVMLMIAAPPEERGPRLSSGGDGRIIYRLAVPVLKIWLFHVVVVQGRQRNVRKSVRHVLSCCSKKLLCFRRFRCCCLRSFVRSLFLEKEGVSRSIELKEMYGV